MNPNDLICAYNKGNLLAYVKDNTEELLKLYNDPENIDEPEWAVHIDMSSARGHGIPTSLGKISDFNEVVNKIVTSPCTPFIFRLIYAIILENIEMSRNNKPFCLAAIKNLGKYREFPWVDGVSKILEDEYLNTN